MAKVYELFNEGPNPRAVMNSSGNRETIAPGATKQISLTPDMVKMLVRRAGSIQIALSDEEAAEHNATPMRRSEDPRSSIFIPDGWKTLKWSDRKDLAQQISHQKIVNGPQAEAVIVAELARRNDERG